MTISLTGSVTNALLLAPCLGARPLLPFQALGDGATPPETRQQLPVVARRQVSQDRAAMNDREKQFSFTFFQAR
jgi:hypothetical protein